MGRLGSTLILRIYMMAAWLSNPVHRIDGFALSLYQFTINAQLATQVFF